MFQSGAETDGVVIHTTHPCQIHPNATRPLTSSFQITERYIGSIHPLKLFFMFILLVKKQMHAYVISLHPPQSQSLELLIIFIKARVF